MPSLTNKEIISFLEEQLSLTFSDHAIWLKALTHRSYRGSTKHNERLEFLGDAVIKLIMSESLFCQYPNETEGYLTKLRAQIVSDKCLYRMAEMIELHKCLRLSTTDKKAGNQRRLSVLANAFEAIMGACYLDLGPKVAEKVLLTFVDRVIEEGVLETLKDYKTVLQEWLQKTEKNIPTYNVIDVIGPEHNKCFIVEVCLTHQQQKRKAKGQGKTKKEAHQVAAKAMLEDLKIPI